MAVIDNPQRKFKSAHVVGTKGKGSTVAMLAGLLRGNDLKVGMYTSPHIMDVRERISVNGAPISESAFTRLIAEVAKAAKKPRVGEPTYFEMVTAVAFLYFVEAGVDIAVIEAGLGGRLDATNIIHPEVIGVTNISLDHMELLGRTVDKIAAEKAGVFKQGVAVISSPQRPSVDGVLRAAAEKSQAPFSTTGKEHVFSYRFESSREAGPHTRICVTTPTSHFEHVRAPMMGDHQAINCALALGMLDVLKSRGFTIDDRKSVDGLAGVSLPGRMELIREGPRVLVDGAHNAASVDALMRAIGQNIPYDSMVIIFGCQRDKDIPGMLRHIRIGADKVIFTTTGSPRSADPVELAARFTEMSSKMCQVAEDLSDAFSIAARAVSREDLICVTGSFYLVGRAKRLLTK
ncbi:MAG: bifunctional folylpolyglutamate synthase/dihydrofolate synthase [Phycisphaerales bacterium]|nr:bifunctional folylpolyglutamate synthase/dihydrofolate synthase [Phycisphaerales bacterium]